LGFADAAGTGRKGGTWLVWFYVMGFFIHAAFMAHCYLPVPERTAVTLRHYRCW